MQARAGHLDDAAATLRASIAHQPKGSRKQQMLSNSLAQIYMDGLRYADAIAIYEEQLKEHGIGSAQLTSDEEKLIASRILQRMIEVYKRAGRASDVTATIERMRQLLGKDNPVPDAQLIAFLREQLAQQARRTPYDIYAALDLGPGGYAIAPSTETRRGVREAIKRKLGR